MWILFMLLIACLMVSDLEAKKHVRQKQLIFKFRDIKCWSSNKTIKDWVMYIKNYNRSLSTLNGRANIIGISYDSKVSTWLIFVWQFNAFIEQIDFLLQHRHVTSVYYNVVWNTTIHFCTFMNETMTNPFMVAFLEASPTFKETFFIRCPTPLGPFSFYNISVSTTSSSVAPQFLLGQYISNLRIYGKFDDNIGSVIVKSELFYG
jgi:hypothetical protein